MKGWPPSLVVRKISDDEKEAVSLVRPSISWPHSLGSMKNGSPARDHTQSQLWVVRVRRRNISPPSQLSLLSSAAHD